MDLFYSISGGMYPGEYRSTAVKVTNCQLVGDGYPSVVNWCLANFADWNHIEVQNRASFHVATINAAKVIPIFFGRKHF